MILFVGGSASGKSELAEKYTTEYASEHGITPVYLATMQVYGEEGRNRVKRHRSLRAGKGFMTVEQEKNLSQLHLAQDSVVLLEDVPNLLANEMYDGDTIQPVSAEKIAGEIIELANQVSELVMVTSDVFREGSYGDDIENYRQILGEINILLAECSHTVTEVTAGIPNILKQVIK